MFFITYRVDPLTRESISESNVFGGDKPLKEVVYGASGDLLKSRLQLTQLGINYQPGEMYRIVVSIDEYMNYGINNKAMPTASCESSIVFTCYDTDEKKNETITDSNGVVRVVEVPDYTPLQWVSSPAPGSYAKVELANGQGGLVDSNTRKIFDIYYQWYLVGENGEDDELIAGMTNVYKGDKSGLQYRSVKNFAPDSDGFTYVNTVDPNDPLKDTYNSNGLPFDKNTWTGEMIHSYLDLDTPDDTLKKDKSFELSLQNNNSFVTGSDRCYIPAEYEGRQIYCKVIAVNTLWPKNYDHVQVFYSHPLKIKKSTLNAPFAVYNGDYATESNPVKIRLSEMPDLSTGEYVNKVVYKSVYNGTECVIDNISAVSLDKIRTVSYPQDFTGANADRSVRNGKIDAYVYTNKGNIYKADRAFFVYEVEATDITISYANSYFYDNTYHASSDWAVESFKLNPVPSNATVGYSFFNGDSFTSSNPDVATIDAKGKLVLGGKSGTTVITVKTPQNTTKSMTVCVPIEEVKVKGISAPTVGEKLDISAIIPTNAGYSVQEIYWTEGTSQYAYKLPVNTVAKAYTNYTVHVVLKEDDGNEFLSYKDTGIEQPYQLTVSLADGSSDTVNGTMYDTNELTYYFTASANGESNIIDTILINYPDEVEEGTSVAEWLNNIQIICNASEVITPEYTITYPSDYTKVLSPLGYSNTDKIGVFISGFQDGLQAELKIPSSVDVTFADKVNVIANDGVQCQVGFYGSRHIMVYANNSITVKPSETTAVQSKPDYMLRPIRMAVGQTVDLSDYIDCKDKSVEFKFINELYESTLSYDAESNTLTAKSKTGSSGTVLHPYVLCDADNDGMNETMVYEYLNCYIYESESDIPVYDDVKVDITILNPDGNVIKTLSKTFPYNDNAVISSKIIELPETEGLLNGYTEYTGNNFYVSGSNLGANQLTQNSTVTVHTFKADSITVIPFAKEARISRNDLLVSVDNVHWFKTNTITGLTPATTYTLYYKQGKNGFIYTKQFTTASKDYGFYLGDMRVTDLNNGSLDKDGWHYDEKTNTLTLKNYTLNAKGNKTGTTSIGSTSYPKTSGAIIADSDMTIHLIGDNIITKQHISDTLYENVIYGYGNITLTGDGNLTLVNTGYQYSGEGSGITSAKNIYLKNTGKLTVNNAMGAFTCENNGTVYYYNGEIDYNGLISSNVYYGSLIYDKGTFSAENKVHSLTAYTGENEDTEISEGDIVTNAKKDKTPMHIIPTHNCNKEVESPEYLVISDKEHGTVYYKSCECGHTDKQSTFTVPYVEPLENTSAISASAITLGDTVTLTGSATGGTAPYQYQMVYKKVSDTKWATKQNFSANTTVSIKPANATDYDVCIKVKDNTGTIEKKFFTVKVTNAKLTNNSTISATEITLGNTITLTGSATGGTVPYTYAMFYKKKSDTKWTTKQDFKANASVSIKPANAVEYDVCIKVKDSTGTIEKKYFSVTVK